MKKPANLQHPPRSLEPYVLQFCQRISSEVPVYVSVIPKRDCPPNECFENVRKVVEKEGGKRILGWAIWELRGAMIEAEFHSVWEYEPGRMVDVTSRKDGEQKILFLSDPSLDYDETQKDNIRFALLDHPAMHEYIKNAEKFFEIMNRGERKFQKAVSVDRYELEPILFRNQELLKLINKLRK